MSFKDILNKAMCTLKPIWLQFVDTLVTGECGCHHAVTMTFKKVVKDDCDGDPEDAKWNMFEADECRTTTQKYTETIDMPVFFGDYSFGNQKVYLPTGTAQVLTTQDNIDKLKQANEIVINNIQYEKSSNPIPMGWDEEHRFFTMNIKECK